MITTFNSATRILSLLQSAMQHNDGENVLNVWQHVFGIEIEGVKRTYSVAAKLAIVYDEIAALEAQLRREKIIAERLFMPALNQALEAFSPLRLASSFSAVRGQMPMEHYRTFEMLEGILRVQDVQASPEEIRELYALIAELQELIAAAQLSPELIALVQNHIETLRRALGNYDISGPRSISEALRIMTLEMLSVQDEVMAEADSKELTLLRTIWQKASAFAEVASTVTDLYGAAQLGWVAATSATTVVLALANS